MEEDFDEATMDACLIAAGQRAEHYEMAAYGTLVAWAQAMGHNEAAELLQETLDEEKAADEKLSAPGRGRHQPGRGRRGASRGRGRRGRRRVASAAGRGRKPRRHANGTGVAEPVERASAPRRLGVHSAASAGAGSRVGRPGAAACRSGRGNGAAADRRHQRPGVRGLGRPGRAGGADGRAGSRRSSAARPPPACRSSTSTTTSASGDRTSARRSRTARRARRPAASSRSGCGRPRRDYFVLKPKHSGFFDTTLDTLLETLGIRRVILTGIAGNICVLFTANDAYMRELKLFAPCRLHRLEHGRRQRPRACGRSKTVLKGNLTPSTRLTFRPSRAKSDGHRARASQGRTRARAGVM